MIKPLTGQVLIHVMPEDPMINGIHIPEAVSGNRFGPVPIRKGIVKAIGPWKKLKNGMAVLPPIGIGAMVLFTDYSGVKLRDLGNSLRLIKSQDLLAVLTK